MTICSFCHVPFAKIFIPGSVKFMNQIPAAHNTGLLSFHRSVVSLEWPSVTVKSKFSQSKFSDIMESMVSCNVYGFGCKEMSKEHERMLVHLWIQQGGIWNGGKIGKSQTYLICQKDYGEIGSVIILRGKCYFLISFGQSLLQKLLRVLRRQTLDFLQRREVIVL